jgi:hypothetical protein
MNLKKSQQRVYDILLDFDKWVVNEKIAVKYYPDHRHAGNNYIAKILAQLINLKLVRSRPYILDGQTMTYHEYVAQPERPQEARKPKIDNKANNLPLTNLNPPQATGVVQVSNPCPVCKSYYRREDKCNICGKQIEGLERV